MKIQKIEVDDYLKYAIRRKIHGFFYRNDVSKVKKIQAAISQNEERNRRSILKRRNCSVAKKIFRKTKVILCSWQKDILDGCNMSN